MRKRAKANKLEIKQIRYWLKYGISEVLCPFGKYIDCAFLASYTVDTISYCKKFFPALNKGRCPCSQYNLKYVKRIARELIRR